MNKIYSLSLILFLATFSANNARAEVAPAQHLLNSLQLISGVPGMSAAVSQDGKIIWTGQSGIADVEGPAPVTAATSFRIASVSKLFTAARALQLAEEGRLDLDADIRTYVPDWPKHDGTVITLRQLAAHISGIAHYGADDRYNSGARYNSLNDSLSVYAHKPLLFAPGEDYSYSSYGYALIGAAIENVTGLSFETNLNQSIIDPLSLTHTTTEDVHFLTPAASRLFTQRGGEIARNDQHHVVGATGILSTPSDLVSFAHAFMNGALVEPSTVDDALTPAKLNNGQNAAAARFAIGFGWRVGENWEGDKVAHHAGVTPGARSILTYNRANGAAAAVLSNAMWTSRIETTGELIATAATERASLAGAACPTGEWNYTGTFVLNPGAPATVASANGALSIMRDGDLCAGEFAPHGALADWLQQLDAGDTPMSATLVAIRNEGLVFALATPWGAFPLVWRGENDPTFSGDIAGRIVRLRVHKTGAAAPPLP